MAFWPTGLFFRMGYTESLFLLMLLLAMYGMENLLCRIDHWLRYCNEIRWDRPPAAIRLESLAAIFRPTSIPVSSDSMAAGMLLGASVLFDLAVDPVWRSTGICHQHASLGPSVSGPD